VNLQVFGSDNFDELGENALVWYFVCCTVESDVTGVIELGIVLELLDGLGHILDQEGHLVAIGVRDGDVEARRALSLREQPALRVQVVC